MAAADKAAPGWVRKKKTSTFVFQPVPEKASFNMVSEAVCEAAKLSPAPSQGKLWNVSKQVRDGEERVCVCV